MPARKPPSLHVAPPAPAPGASGPGDATLVYDQGKPRAHPEARLLVTAGPRKGAEHTLAGERTTIGRGQGNLLVIPDLSVSRQHSRVEKQEGRWVVLDQGSGNGTRVNGKPVTRHALRHGDEIELGDTRLKFVEPGGVLVKGASSPAAPRFLGESEVTDKESPLAGKTLKRRAPLYLAILAGLAIVFAAGLLRRQRELRRQAEAAAQRDESREFAQKRFQEGVALLKAGRWVEARDKLKIAAVLDAQDREIARYLESAEAEAPRAQQLASARAALARRDYAFAREALSGLPDESALAEGSHQLSRQLRDALDAAVREAKSRAETGDAAGARELLDPVLLAEPSRADALAVQEAIAGQRRSSPPPGRRRERAQAGAVPGVAPEVEGILEPYLLGDLEAALGRAQSVQGSRGERLLEDLKTFQAAYQDGLAGQQARRPAEALRALEQAASIDRKIAEGKDGRLGREVRQALSALHTELGVAQAGSDEGLPEAAAHLRAAVQNDAGNEVAKAQLQQIDERCKEIYLRGYVDKDQDVEAARKAFQLVVETLPPADETAQKARRWLDKLDGKASN